MTQRAVYRVNYKTELAVNEIVNRLTYRIQKSTISKDHLAFTDKDKPPTANDWLPIADVPTGGTKYTTIEWIGYDNDSFSSDKIPNWSGVANYQTASIDGFTTLGSDLNNTAKLVSYLSNGKVNLTSSKAGAVVFVHNYNYYTGIREYSPDCMGLIPELNSSTDCIFPYM